MKNIHGFLLEEQATMPHPRADAYSDRALELSAGPLPGVAPRQELSWGPERWQRFDVFRPSAASSEPRPLLVFYHGGGWVAGHKEWSGFAAPGTVQAGAILVAPTYRFAPQHRYPAFLHDAVEALIAIHDRAASFGGDPNRIYLAGHSAGGHIAAMIALKRELWLDRIGDVVKGALIVSGTLDLHHPEPEPGTLEELVYTTILSRPGDDHAASPVNLASQAKVPFLLQWGEKDTPRIQKASPLMVARLGDKLLEATCFPGYDHFDTHLALAEPDGPFFQAFRRMLARDVV